MGNRGGHQRFGLPMSQRSPIMAPLAIFPMPLALNPNRLSDEVPDAVLAAYTEPSGKNHSAQPAEVCRPPYRGVSR